MSSPTDILVTLVQGDAVIKIGFFLMLILSLAIHEWGHAFSALKLGDDLAQRLGRVTLNPIPHLDPVFSVLLPAFLIFSGAPFLFGAGKPVPVDPRNLGKPTRDMMLVSIAGPAMNVVMAFGLIAAFHVFLRVKGIHEGMQPILTMHQEPVSFLLLTGIQLNFFLAVFNMIPAPPFDGHRVLGYFMPAQTREKFYRMQWLGLVAIVVLFRSDTAQSFLRDDILGPISDAVKPLMPGQLDLF